MTNQIFIEYRKLNNSKINLIYNYIIQFYEIFIFYNTL